MENLYGYVFWHNSFDGMWYAIETKNYTDFMISSKNRKNTLKSNKIETLIDIIVNPTKLENN